MKKANPKQGSEYQVGRRNAIKLSRSEAQEDQSFAAQNSKGLPFDQSLVPLMDNENDNFDEMDLGEQPDLLLSGQRRRSSTLRQDRPSGKPKRRKLRSSQSPNELTLHMKKTHINDD